MLLMIVAGFCFHMSRRTAVPSRPICATVDDARVGYAKRGARTFVAEGPYAFEVTEALKARGVPKRWLADEYMVAIIERTAKVQAVHDGLVCSRPYAAFYGPAATDFLRAIGTPT
jgi:hypothetical protein